MYIQAAQGFLSVKAAAVVVGGLFGAQWRMSRFSGNIHKHLVGVTV